MGGGPPSLQSKSSVNPLHRYEPLEKEKKKKKKEMFPNQIYQTRFTKIIANLGFLSANSAPKPTLPRKSSTKSIMTGCVGRQRSEDGQS